MIRFSVIIPTYNRKAYLLDCLETVFAQSHPAYEIIVVDDGSTDGTVEALSSFGDRVRVIRQSNAGPGAARNRGAKVASGDYLAFLDSDDLWFPWTMATFAKIITRNARPSFVSGYPKDFVKTEELAALNYSNLEYVSFQDYLSSSAMGYFCGSGTMVVSHAAFYRVSGFEEDGLNAEDHDLALRLGTASGFVAILSPITLGRRLHANNETIDTIKSLKGIKRLVKKERDGLYPGGPEVRIYRREILSRHIRPAVINAFKAGHFFDAWSLYIDTFNWQLRIGRFAYLVAAPLIGVLRKVSFDG